MTAKEEKFNFITQYFDDWIPDGVHQEAVQRLDELIESHCREQRDKQFSDIINKLDDIIDVLPHKITFAGGPR